MFSLENAELVNVKKFIAEHESKHGRCKAVAGGRYSYEFTPTGIGTVVVIKCACGTAQDVTDYKCW